MSSRQRLAARPLAMSLALLVGVAFVSDSPVEAATAGADAAMRGAYCPLPEPGQKPACLDPARARYQPFFSALERGEVDPEQSARIEADLVRGGDDSEEAFLALSSLAYAYWRLGLRAAESEALQPELLTRLEGWNDVIAAAYESSGQDSEFRAALRQAADDLHARAPSQGLRCLDSSGQLALCQPTTGLIETLARFNDQLGLRGAIRRVLERMFGSSET